MGHFQTRDTNFDSLKEENPSLQSDELLLPGEAEVRLPDPRCHRVG